MVRCLKIIILERDQTGEEMLKQFAFDRLTEGKLGVWDKMQKQKLQTFKSTSATAEMRMGDKLIKVKEELGLLQRLIVISRSRPELDLKECIGAYEFGVIPRSLFASDGSMLFACNKAKILHQLEKLLVECSQAQRHVTQDETMTENSDVNEVDMITNADVNFGAETLMSQQSIEPSAHDPQVSSDEQTHGSSFHVRSQIDTPSHSGVTPNHKVIIIAGMALVNKVRKTDQ